MNKRKEVILELFEEYDKVNYYTLKFKNNELSEAETFFSNFSDTSKYDDEIIEDLQIMITLIEKIGNNGAHERYFRRAGKIKDNLAELPQNMISNNLRLYCIRLNENIVILGNGGIKNTRTYNEDPTLNNYVETLRLIDRFLYSRLISNSIEIRGKKLKGGLKFYI
ncbi:MULTISPECIES: hypothetical protein [unclassified Tenacibaculum]|uniref:hypothetical protein n=1 Tax=unclassified Tenacibaculum TaxID=2635139 RepID=UPI001F30582C|nr:MULTISPECIES: hypothetical protein [unclassified Tenacibaculum]MCF2875450.1 hypothetical protein [Tenacibaculum sp. Cn5-1]MCF2935526.1 hypothetical protein [Tenacibaculum sp. Cn5-34]MCG7512086.1 hypothetical protein [Tenacibaculum sp. Cn5-46]